MSFPVPVVRITDQLGTDYTDLFADVLAAAAPNQDLFDMPVGAAPHSPRANAAGPLGALIVRWIQARVESPTDIFGWQYLDVYDLHTIAFVEGQQVRFINIPGRLPNGGPCIMRDIAYALGLQHDAERPEI